MIQGNHNILIEVLSVLRQELSDVNVQIHYILLSLKREQLCNVALNNSEDQIQRLRKRKVDLEQRIKHLSQIFIQEDSGSLAFDDREEDRRRIAMDLHDTALQSLVHLIHKIELCDLYIEKDPIEARQELYEIKENLKEIVNEIRGTIFDLRPIHFEETGLKENLESLLKQVNDGHKYDIYSDIDPVSCENNFVLLYIYRTVQEALNNITKHAEAKRIALRCKKINSVCILDIEDDGKGFQLDTDEMKKGRHLGLSLMKERVELLNGRLDIVSAEGKGTKVHMEIPLAE